MRWLCHFSLKHKKSCWRCSGFCLIIIATKTCLKGCWVPAAHQTWTNLSCMWFPVLAVSHHLRVSTHSSLKQKCPKYSLLNTSNTEQLVPEHWLFSALAAVHLVTVVEEDISAARLLVIVPAQLSTFLEGDEPEGRTPPIDSALARSFAGRTWSALTHLRPNAPSRR